MPKMLLIDLCTDHPRSCGANVSDQRENTVQDGSSPLVRGQLEPADDEDNARDFAHFGLGLR